MGLLLAGSLAASCVAEEIPELLQPLRHGPLTVWVITPAQPKIKIPSNYATKLPSSMGYQEQSSGSFGQSASSYGQNAGGYGAPSDTQAIATRQPAQGQDAPTGSGYQEQTSGSFGQTSSSYGSTASDHGQTAGSFGANAGSVGTNASNHGQTAGSFGQASGSFGVGATPSGQQASSTSSTTGAARPVASALQTTLAQSLRHDFPELEVHYVDVAVDQLKDRLTAASADYPDVLVGMMPDSWSAELRGRFILLTLQPAAVYDDGLDNKDGEDYPHFFAVSVTTRAPHREPARALALWASEHIDCVGCQQPDIAKKPYGSVALNAVSRLVRGQAVGELADPDMAAFPPLLGRGMLLTSATTTADDSAAHLQILEATRNGRLAAVSLRLVEASESVFGTAHPLVILRLGSDGQWKVLHVSLNLPALAEQRIRRAFMSTRPNAVAEVQTGVMGVKLATPADGDVRQPAPELSWDNGGGAGLQVVEWQTAIAGGWSDARLFLVKDNMARLQTEVTAGFAMQDTRYRWRVWSVGAGGEMKISPWRTMNIAR